MEDDHFYYESDENEGLQEEENDGIDEETEAMLYRMAYLNSMECDSGMVHDSNHNGPQLVFSAFVGEDQFPSGPENSFSLNENSRPTNISSSSTSSLPFTAIKGQKTTQLDELNGNDDFTGKENAKEAKQDCHQNEAPEVIHFSSSRSSSSSSTTSKNHVKSNFDLEAELGIERPPKVKKWSKSKDVDTVNGSIKKPKFVEEGAKCLSPDVCGLDAQKKPGDKKSLGQCSSSREADSIKGEISMQSDNCDTRRSSSSDGDDSGSEDDSDLSDSSSESIVMVLGKPCADKPSADSTLNLNWNVTDEDQQIIQNVAQRSLKDDSKWKIIDADRQAASSSDNFKKEICCHNCRKKGHLSKACPEPKKSSCALCGEKGHPMHRCKRSLCFNCSQPGHKGIDCTAPRRSRFTICTRCKMRGHKENECPDHWRQYHMTTTSADDLVPSKEEVNTRIYCCNCAKRGHFAFECRRDRMDKHGFPGYPFIAKYDVKSVTSKSWIEGQSYPESKAGGSAAEREGKNSYVPNGEGTQHLSQSRKATKLQDLCDGRNQLKKRRYNSNIVFDSNPERYAQQRHEHKQDGEPSRPQTVRHQAKTDRSQLPKFSQQFVQNGVQSPKPQGRPQQGMKRCHSDSSDLFQKGPDKFTKKQKKQKKIIDVEEFLPLLPAKKKKKDKKKKAKRNQLLKKNSLSTPQTPQEQNQAAKMTLHKKELVGKGKKKKSVLDGPSTSVNGRGSMFATSPAGFRVNVKTMEQYRKYCNTQC